MPDITLCTNQDCPRQDNCWRLNAPPKVDGTQSYFAGDWSDEAWDCPDYWPIDERREEK